MKIIQLFGENEKYRTLIECVSEGSQSEVEHKTQCRLELAYEESKVLGLDKAVTY